VLVAASVAGCGGSNSAGTAATTTGSTAGSAPVGCTHHLVFANHGSPAGRQIALSFDDTPSPYTEGIFRTLLRHHVVATFFVIGGHIDGKAGLLREMVDDGMELGNHSYTHPRGLATEGEGASLELQAANAAILQATGFRPCLFRPPYGALTPDLVQRAKEAGLTATKWDVDPADWTHPGVQAIQERVLAGAKPGAIVIMHDNVETRGETVRALPAILEGLAARGYRLVTVSRVLGDEVVMGRASG